MGFAIIWADETMPNGWAVSGDRAPDEPEAVRILAARYPDAVFSDWLGTHAEGAFEWAADDCKRVWANREARDADQRPIALLLRQD